MYERKQEPDIRCPLEYGLSLIGSRWKSRIICVLDKQAAIRYNELKAQMVNITDAVLSSALRDLAKNGLVKRTQYEQIPPKVEYSLTEQGREIVPLLKAICSWAGHYYKPDADELPSACLRCSYRVADETSETVSDT